MLVFVVRVLMFFLLGIVVLVCCIFLFFSWLCLFLIWLMARPVGRACFRFFVMLYFWCGLCGLYGCSVFVLCLFVCLNGCDVMLVLLFCLYVFCMGLSVCLFWFGYVCCYFVLMWVYVVCV